MDNDMKFYFSSKFCDEERNTGVAKQNALNLIAKEIQRYLLESKTRQNKLCKCCGDGNKPVTKDTGVAKHDMKDKQLEKLKENLKTVRNIVKIVLTAKNRETELLQNKLHDIRKESSQLRNSNEENLNLIQQLQVENYNIHNDVQFLSNFIQVAYIKLQKMRNEPPRDIPFVDQLKTILLACGQYYEDYCYVRERCNRLERLNRFLKSKLNIVENNLTATTEELRNLRILNMKLQMKNEIYHKNADVDFKKLRGLNVTEGVHDKLLNNGIRSGLHDAAIPQTIGFKHTLPTNKNLCVTSHLETVKKLILDQDNVIQELKELYLEVTTTES